MLSQGDQGEDAAIAWLGATFRNVAIPVGHCDHLYVHAVDGRRWFIPADRVESGTGIVLCGPKYAECEVEPGATLSLS